MTRAQAPNVAHPFGFPWKCSTETWPVRAPPVPVLSPSGTCPRGNLFCFRQFPGSKHMVWPLPAVTTVGADLTGHCHPFSFPSSRGTRTLMCCFRRLKAASAAQRARAQHRHKRTSLPSTSGLGLAPPPVSQCTRGSRAVHIAIVVAQPRTCSCRPREGRRH